MTTKSPKLSTLMRAAACGLTLAALAAPAASRAGDASMEVPRSYRALMKMKAIEVMHMMDPGKTGFVTKADYMAFHEAMYEKMDRNKDGKLSKSEWLDRSEDKP